MLFIHTNLLRVNEIFELIEFKNCKVNNAFLYDVEQTRYYSRFFNTFNINTITISERTIKYMNNSAEK